MTLLGHELTTHESNSHARIPLCSCGWIGTVHPVPVTYEKRDGTKRKTGRLLHEQAMEAARREWYDHLQNVDIARASAVAIGAPIAAELAARMRHP